MVGAVVALWYNDELFVDIIAGVVVRLFIECAEYI